MQGAREMMPMCQNLEKVDLQQINGLIDAAGISGAKEIMFAFWRSTDTLMENLDETLSAADYCGAKSAAHALKGSAANVGAAGITDAARQIEAAVNANDLETANDANEALKDAVEEARAQFDRHLARREAA